MALAAILLWLLAAAVGGTLTIGSSLALVAQLVLGLSRGQGSLRLGLTTGLLLLAGLLLLWTVPYPNGAGWNSP
jgi:hypothetical protein